MEAMEDVAVRSMLTAPPALTLCCEPCSVSPSQIPPETPRHISLNSSSSCGPAVPSSVATRVVRRPLLQKVCV